ncbi:MAG: chromosomal replication initiator protein DnaA [Planctomycetes bacterium]|nr:chromosomal replication initiator protein DnaA [Planctomycetota bacterium]
MDRTVAEKVCHIRERVVDRIGANRYRTWFGESTEFALCGTQLDVLVANAFVGSWIASNYLDDLKEATRSVLGEDACVDVRVNQRAPQADAGERAQPPDVAAQQRRSGTRTARATRLRGNLDTFVVGACNRLAFSAVAQVVRSPAQAFKPLVLHGGCGLGKTHLLQGICNGVNRSHPTLAWRYISGEEFTNEFISAVKTRRVDGFRARFREVDLLVIDDIHFLANKKATQEEFLHTFNAIDACGKAVVLSTDRHPRSIATLSEPLISRLIAGMVVQIDAPDMSTRREILRRRADAMQCDISAEVLDFVARRVTRNVRELEGALYKLVALASLTKEAITLSLTRAALEDHVSRGQQRPEADVIIRTVASRFGASVELLNSKARDRTASLARASAMYLLRKHTQMSFPAIGHLMGNKNHSTVLMATRRIEQILDKNDPVSWHTLAGTQQARLSELLASIERDLLQEND